MQNTYRETWKEICFILSGQTNVSEKKEHFAASQMKWQ
jgi:hypothetical protein